MAPDPATGPYKKIFYKKVVVASIHVESTQAMEGNFHGTVSNKTTYHKKDILRPQKCSCWSQSHISELRLKTPPWNSFIFIGHQVPWAGHHFRPFRQAWVRASPGWRSCQVSWAAYGTFLHMDFNFLPRELSFRVKKSTKQENSSLFMNNIL